MPFSVTRIGRPQSRCTRSSRSVSPEATIGQPITVCGPGISTNRARSVPGNDFPLPSCAATRAGL